MVGFYLAYLRSSYDTCVGSAGRMMALKGSFLYQLLSLEPHLDSTNMPQTRHTPATRTRQMRRPMSFLSLCHRSVVPLIKTWPCSAQSWFALLPWMASSQSCLLSLGAGFQRLFAENTKSASCLLSCCHGSIAHAQVSQHTPLDPHGLCQSQSCVGNCHRSNILSQLQVVVIYTGRHATCI